MSFPEPEPKPEVVQAPPELPATSPPPVLTGPSALDIAPRYTTNDWLMFALGTLLGLVSILTLGLATLVLTVLFFTRRPPRPPIWRGIGLGVILVGITLLGALTVCFIALGTY